MTIYPIRTCLFFSLVVVLAAPAIAQDTSRDASFLPLETSSLPASQSVSTPVPSAPATTTPVSLAPVTVSPQAPVAAPAPLVPAAVVTPTPTTTQTPAPTPVTSPVMASPTATPAAQAPALVSPPTAASITVPTPSAAPSVVLPVSTAIAKPVEAAAIGSIDPESIGLLSKTEGDFGADLWKGTSRTLVAKLFPALNLPTASKVLNQLARRLLLTTASVPEGTSDSKQSLTSMRVEKLLALGNTQDAWKLTALVKPDQIDEITLRLVAEAALISPQSDDVCAKLPEIVKAHNGAEWQKLMLVCQLRAKDAKAAQVTLDLLHAQNVKDDIFFFIAEKNIIGGNKQLPRQLTPLKPLTLALLRIADLPLPGEVYVHPDAALIPELLAAKAREEVARLGLAERAAERGLISGADLAAVYHGTLFAPDSFANAANSSESGPRLHALLYQAALQEKTTQARIADAVKFMQTASPALLINAAGPVLEEMIGTVTPTEEFNAVSGVIAHVFVLAGKNETALEWIKLAKHASIGMPAVTAELNSFWPLTVLSGLESDADYASNLTKWLDGYLKNTDSKNDERARRDQAASILLLLEANGFAVSNDAWVKVIDISSSEKRTQPPTLFLERLRAASTGSRRGEAIMLALAMAGGSNDINALSAVEAVHALRVMGLTSDAALLARETASILLTTKP